MTIFFLDGGDGGGDRCAADGEAEVGPHPRPHGVLLPGLNLPRQQNMHPPGKGRRLWKILSKISNITGLKVLAVRL